MDIKIEDLIQTCTACNGDGWIGDDANSSQGYTYGQSSFGRTNRQSCGLCNSTGKMLTDSGKAIASLISHLRMQGRI